MRWRKGKQAIKCIHKIQIRREISWADPPIGEGVKLIGHVKRGETIRHDFVLDEGNINVRRMIKIEDLLPVAVELAHFSNIKIAVVAVAP